MKKFILFFIALISITLFSKTKTFAIPCADGSVCNITNMVYNPCVGCGGTVTFNWTICNAAPGTVYQFLVSYTGGGISGGAFTYTPIGNCQSGTGAVFIGNFKNNVIVEIMNTNLGFCIVPINAALPVILSSFEVIPVNNTTKIKWSTSQEIDFKGFAIEKSTDGIAFEEIGYVNGHDNSGKTNEYYFQDMQNTTAISYYRLKMIDIDDKYSYSKIEKVIRTCSNEISIYPNPCTMILNILMPENTQTSTIEIYAMDGRKIIAEKSNELTHKIDINSLTKGTYMLRVFNNEKAFTTKFVRQ